VPEMQMSSVTFFALTMAFMQFLASQEANTRGNIFLR